MAVDPALSPPPTRGAWALAALRELPLALGLLGGLGLLWWLGQAGVFNGQLEGYRWPDYVYNAWMVDLGLPDRYDAFRRPLHAWLLARLSHPLGSMPDAAVLVATASMGATVLGAGLLGRALAGPWAGGLAALAVGFGGPATDAARWANLYPLLSATTALSLGLAACTARWPGLGLGALAGLAAALAWGSDDRGVLLLPCCAGLVALGASAAPGWRRWALLPLWLVLAVGGGTALAEGFGQRPDKQLSAERKRVIQQDVVARYIQISQDAPLIAACAPVRPQELLTRGFLGGPCSQALVDYNRRAALRPFQPFGSTWTWWLVPLALLPPAGRRLRGSLEGLLGLVLPMGVLAGVCAFTPMQDRYTLQFTALLCAGVPVALGRLAALWRGGAWAWGLAGLGTLAAAQQAWVRDPSGRYELSGIQFDTHYRDWNEAAALARRLLGPDDRLLDCSAHSLNLSLLPAPTWTGPQVNLWQDTVQEDVLAACEAWLAAPQGGAARWVAIARQPPDSPDPKAQASYRRLRERVAAGGGWEAVDSTRSVVLYRWGP